MEQFKNQVVVINGISYFITDDIEGLDLNTDFISSEEVNVNDGLNFIESTAENVEGFDLTDDFFGVIEGLPEKTKKAFFKTTDESPSLQLDKSSDEQQEVEVTTIPITFDLSEINRPLISAPVKVKSPQKQKTQIIVQKSKSNSSAVQKTLSSGQQWTSQNKSQKIIVKVKQEAEAKDQTHSAKPRAQSDQQAVTLVLDNDSGASPNVKTNTVQISPSSGQDSEIHTGEDLVEDSIVDVEKHDDEQEQTSFLSSFTGGSRLSEFRTADFGESIVGDEGNQELDTLGSSENPIQLIQKGAKFHSLQPLSQEQLQQVAAILRQQNRKDLMKNTENVVFDKKTNTKIVCKIVYPENIVVKKKGRGRPMKTLAIPVQVEPENGEDDDTEKEKRVEMKRTRYGRLSKPPRHVVRDYKRLNKLCEDGLEAEGSDGGYSDYEVPPQTEPLADSFPDMPRRKKRKLCTNYRCLHCDKIYLGIAKLATHYARNPDHGTIEQHLEHIAKQPLYTQDLPEQKDSLATADLEPSCAEARESPASVQPAPPSVAEADEPREEVDSDPIVEAFKPVKKKRGRPRKDDDVRKNCKLKHGLITAAAAFSTFDAYATLIPRLVEISPFEHLLSCSKSKKVLAGNAGSLVPFVFDQMEKLLDELSDFVNVFLTTEELPEHETYKVTNELLRTVCNLNDGTYYLRDGGKRPPPPPSKPPTPFNPRSSAKVISGFSSFTTDKPSRAEEVIETDADARSDSNDSISNLFSTDKENTGKTDMLDLFEPERGALHDKANTDSVFEFFRDRKESLSINDIPVDTAALRQVDDIVDQVASQAGQLVSPDPDYRSPHSVTSYRNSPASVHSSYRNSPYRQSPRVMDEDRLSVGKNTVIPELPSGTMKEELDLNPVSDAEGEPVQEPERPFRNIGSASHPCSRSGSPATFGRRNRDVFETKSASCSKTSSPAHGNVVESFPLRTLPEPDLYTETFVEQASENVAPETAATFENEEERNNFEQGMGHDGNIISLDYNTDSWWT